MFFGEVIASINSNQWFVGSSLWFSVLTNEELTISKQLIKTFHQSDAERDFLALQLTYYPQGVNFHACIARFYPGRDDKL